MADDNLTLCSPRVSSGLDPNAPVLVRSPKPVQLPPNHVLLRVDRFGFSANNVTYQALGEIPHFRSERARSIRAGIDVQQLL
jgi:hypothetical protein